MISLCLICALAACDKSKNHEAVNLGEQEPALESFRKVALDSTIASVMDVEKEEVEVEIPVAIEREVVKKKPTNTPKPKKKRAVIVFDSLIYHMPDMYEGDQSSLDLRFINEGDAPLSIKEVDVVCGCTTPEVPFLDILPGEEGKIGIQYNSVGKEGLQEPEITVISNGIPRKTVLKIVVNVLDKKSKKDSTDVKLLQDTLPN